LILFVCGFVVVDVVVSENEVRGLIVLFGLNMSMTFD